MYVYAELEFASIRLSCIAMPRLVLGSAKLPWWVSGLECELGTLAIASSNTTQGSLAFFFEIKVHSRIEIKVHLAVCLECVHLPCL